MNKRQLISKVNTLRAKLLEGFPTNHLDAMRIKHTNAYHNIAQASGMMAEHGRNIINKKLPMRGLSKKGIIRR